jgi:hypothetical protein
MADCPPRLKTDTRWPVRPSGRVGIAAGAAAGASACGHTAPARSAAVAAPPVLMNSRRLRSGGASSCVEVIVVSLRAG